MGNEFPVSAPRGRTGKPNFSAFRFISLRRGAAITNLRFMRPYRSVLSCILFSLYFPFFQASDSSAQGAVERWIHPGFAQIDSPLYEVEAQYPTALRESDVFQFFAEDVANLGFSEASRASLRARIALLKKYGVKISVEAIGINPADGWAHDPSPDGELMYCKRWGVCGNGPGQISAVTLGQESARITLRKLQPIYDADGEVSYLGLDYSAIGGALPNPYATADPRTHTNALFTLEEALTVLTTYMQAIHNGISGYAGRPNIKIGVVTNFPNVNYNGVPSFRNEPELNGLDFEYVLERMEARTREVGEALWFVHADSPYNLTVLYPAQWPWGGNIPNSSINYFSRLLSLKDQTRSLGLRFGAVFNTDRSGSYGTDQRYTDETLAYIRAFRQAAGDPDDFIIESWYNLPTATFPETTQYTFMNLVKKVATPGTLEYWGADHSYSRRLDQDIFDWRYYLGTDPILQSLATQHGQPRVWAESHWLAWGVNEGRKASSLFSASYYLNKYSDLAQAFGWNNYAAGMDHYFYQGRYEEGRLARVSRISGGLQHSAVQRQLRVLHASGQGVNGQLGTGGASGTSSPVAAVSQFEITDLASGPYNSLAVNDDGRVYAWGSNQYGQLGNGTTGSQANTATLVPNLANVVTQTADGRHIVSSNYGACAVVDNLGQVWMWGVNSEGQLGDGTTTPHYIPKRVMVATKTALSGVVSVAAGSGHTVALRNDGTVWAWGNGQNGALGNGSTLTQLRPVQVMTMSGPLTNVKQVVAGGSRFSIALKQDGTIWGWGANGSGQLGVNDTIDRTMATYINPGVGVTRIAAGAYHSLCLSTGGHVYAWGYNGYGQLGNPAAGLVRTSPIQMREDNGMNNITDVSAGGYFSLMLRVTDQGVEKVFTVGDNQSGQLAVGNYVARNIPVLSLY
jgi:alpha-tubulin suppressor-like RCC1 family protein